MPTPRRQKLNAETNQQAEDNPGASWLGPGKMGFRHCESWSCELWPILTGLGVILD